MNIEEERKAFEEAYLQNRMDYAVSKNLSIEIMRVRVLEMLGGDLYPHTMFDIWLAAKKHAEEMAKPVCIIWEKKSSIHFPWKVDNYGAETVHHAATAEEARVWATSNGYRVIEE